VHDPVNVLLDEPTNGLDVMATRALRDMILELRAEGRCVVLSSHVMQEIGNLCDDVVIVGAGRTLYSGTRTALHAETGEADLEDAFMRVIGAAER
jgi:sodium transport system ATP-binding protein